MKAPNIIFILADDLGYGDLQCFQPEGKIPTPHLDALAQGGLRCTNAHAASSICTPSRYNVLTGRYAWKSRLKHGIVWEWDEPLIESDRTTVAKMLQKKGYRTTCIGKWHLGWEWSLQDGRPAAEEVNFGKHEHDRRQEVEKKIDYKAPIQGGPTARGFDHYFGVDVPNFPPYAWFEDDHLTELPTEPKADHLYGHPGSSVANWSHEAMLPEFARRAVATVEAGESDNAPFFLYMPLTSPHSPVTPSPKFQGRSGAGNYGDFVCETDWVVGQVIDALKRTGQLDNTLVIFTSDNGPKRRVPDDSGIHDRSSEYGHCSTAHWRGMKRDVWEGGHRVPYIAHWPSVIPPGESCDQLITLGDFMATCADIHGVELAEDEAEDSISLLPLFQGEDRPVRGTAVHLSGAGNFAIRKENWIFIDANCGGDNPEPDWLMAEKGYLPHDEPGELFDLNQDPSERINL